MRDCWRTNINGCSRKRFIGTDVIVKAPPVTPHNNNPDNPIYNAIPVIEWFNSYQFEKISEVLVPKMTVTQVTAGKQHVTTRNVIWLSISVNDCYNNQEILDTVSDC
jgi:acetylornithine deacetylase